MISFFFSIWTVFNTITLRDLRLICKPTQMRLFRDVSSWLETAMYILFAEMNGSYLHD